VHLEKQFPAGRRLRLRQAGRADAAAAAWNDRLDRRSSRKSVYPDIVVHQREIPNNLLAIEVRKASNHQPPEHDQHKLRALTDPHLWFAYWIGVYVTLGKKQARVGCLRRRRDRQAAVGWLAGRLKDAGLG
jgi:hypothetical protein